MIFLYTGIITPPDVSQDGLSFTYKLYFFFFFYQSTVLVSAAAQWMANVFRRFGRKALTVGNGIKISPISPNFCRSQKVRNLASFKTSLNFEPHALAQQDSRNLIQSDVQCCDDRHILATLVKLGPCIPEKPLSVLSHPIKLHAKTR